MLTRQGLSCDQFLMNEVYGLSRFGSGNSYDGVIRFVQSRDVPTLYIDVPSGSMEYIHQKKGNEESGTMRLYTVDGDLCSSGSVASIKGRGNATWGTSKRSYSLTLSEQADLLGMGQAQRWILLSNVYDRSNLKNKITYELAESAGMAFSPECRWIDLYLNGEYAGLYLLCERNEVHPNRVDISPDNSFLVSREYEPRLIAQKYPYVRLKLGSFRIHHSSLDQSAVKAMWSSLESALLAENGTDPHTQQHWTDLIDLDSWAEKYLIDEITANYDGGFISQYFYCDGADPSGKIYAGPVWDMDSTYGAVSWRNASPNSFTTKRPFYLDNNYSAEHYSDVSEYSPFYLLYQKTEFYRRMVEIYQHHFRPALLELLDSGLDRYAREISQAVKMDELRWHAGTPEAQQATEQIRVFLTERIAFLDALWIDEEDFCDVLLFREREDAESTVIAWFAVRPGECLPEIPTAENEAWYVCGSDEPFDVTQPVYESLNIYRKQEPLAQPSGEEETSMAPFAVLIISLLCVWVADQVHSQRNGTKPKQRA